MYPILGRYGSFFFYSYTVALGSSLLLVLALVRAPARRSFGDTWWHGIVLALLAGLVAGRSGFVLSHLDYFRLHPDESWQIWRGGLSYYLALPVALVILFFWCRLQAISFYRLAALLAPGALLWGAAGWFACWLDGCAYGRETTLGWAAADLADHFGVFAIRYQSQLLGVALYLILALLVGWLASRLQPGALFWLALALASASRAVVSAWRGDPFATINGWRLDTLLDVLLALGASGLFLVMVVRRGIFRRLLEEV